MKSEEHKLTVQIKGDGPLQTMLVTANNFPKLKGYVANAQVDLPLNEFGKLLSRGDLYYISGDIVVMYRSSMDEIYKKFTKMRSALSTGAIRILHIFEEDVYFSDNGKNASSLIDGPMLEEYLIERM